MYFSLTIIYFSIIYLRLHVSTAEQSEIKLKIEFR